MISGRWKIEGRKSKVGVALSRMDIAYYVDAEALQALPPADATRTMGLSSMLRESYVAPHLSGEVAKMIMEKGRPQRRTVLGWEMPAMAHKVEHVELEVIPLHESGFNSAIPWIEEMYLRSQEDVHVLAQDLAQANERHERYQSEYTGKAQQLASGALATRVQVPPDWAAIRFTEDRLQGPLTEQQSWAQRDYAIDERRRRYVGTRTKGADAEYVFTPRDNPDGKAKPIHMALYNNCYEDEAGIMTSEQMMSVTARQMNKSETKSVFSRGRK